MNKQAEEVIKGLEVCKTASESIEGCEGCPYNDGEDDCIARMAADALELLKARQENEQTCAGCVHWDGAVCMNGESGCYTMETSDGCEKRAQG